MFGMSLYLLVKYLVSFSKDWVVGTQEFTSVSVVQLHTED